MGPGLSEYVDCSDIPRAIPLSCLTLVEDVSLNATSPEEFNQNAIDEWGFIREGIFLLNVESILSNRLYQLALLDVFILRLQLGHLTLFNMSFNFLRFHPNLRKFLEEHSVISTPENIVVIYKRD